MAPGNLPKGTTEMTTTPTTATVKLTDYQSYLLDDMRVAGSDSYLAALDAGVRLDDYTLTLHIPLTQAATHNLGVAIGIRADIADEGNYSIGERRSWLSLARKVAQATGDRTALPLA